MSETRYQQLQDWILSGRPPSAVSGVAGPSPEYAEQRVRIYWEAYRLRLREALRADYPGLANAMGEARFSQWCVTLMNRSPPTHYNLDQYSLEFGQQLLPMLDDPVEQEIARFEHHLLSVVHSAEDPKLNVAALLALADDERLASPIQLIAAARLDHYEALPVNVVNEIQWLWTDQGQCEPLTLDGVRAQVKAEVLSGPVLLWRHRSQLAMKRLSALEAHLLGALHTPQSLAALLETLAANDQLSFSTLLREWVVGECLTSPSPSLR